MRLFFFLPKNGCPKKTISKIKVKPRYKNNHFQSKHKSISRLHLYEMVRPSFSPSGHPFVHWFVMPL